MNRLTLFCLACLLGLLTACNTDPKVSSRRYVDNGKKYFDRGKFKQASIMYRRALQKDPRNAEAWYRLGLTNITESNLGEARRDFQRCSALLEAPARKANSAGGPATTPAPAVNPTPGSTPVIDEPLLNPLTPHDPLWINSLSKLGDMDVFAHSVNPKVQEFSLELNNTSLKLLKDDPKSFDGLRLAAFYSMSLLDEREKFQGEEGKRLFLQRLADAISKFRTANAVKPYQPDVVSMLVQLLIANNQGPEAEKLGRELIEKQKNFDKMYDILYAQFLRTNRPQEAEQILKLKIANNPQRPDFVAQLAYFYYLTHRKPEMLATLSQVTADKNKFPHGHLVVGDFYYGVRAFNDAVLQYREGEKDDPKERFTYQKKLVEALTVSGKHDEAAKVVAELVREHPKDPETIAMHASVLLEGADPRQADGIIAELKPVLVATPANQRDRLAILHYNLARAYALKGDSASFEQAKRHFQDTLTARENYIPAKLALAQVELSNNESPQAVQHATEILNVDKNNLTAKLVRTIGRINMKDYDKASQELAVMEREYPNSGDVRFQVGRLKFAQGRIKEAESDFELLLKSNDLRGLNGLIECKLAQGQVEEAIKLVQTQVLKTPDNFQDRLILGSLEVNAKKYQDAIKDFQLLIDKNPKSPDLPGVYIRLGEAKRRAGDLDGAIASFRKARELSPKDPVPLLQVALLFDTNGRPDEARKTYEDVLKMQPDNPVALNNIAYAKADEGVDLDNALQLAERARTKKPDDPDVLDTVSLIFLKKNSTDEGLRLLKELVARVPANPTYHLHLALALYQKGNKPEAKKELETASRFNPSERDQQRIRELMAKIG
ncbi:MAG: tetratricopeptide repeat protein [Acidobacteriota bacterium]|nr:tetratricopeptide repeat protein [Acidobacteriota bacterium]